MRAAKIMIRLSDSEKSILDAAAESEGLATSSWGRFALLKAAKTGTPQPIKSRNEYLVAGELLSIFCGPGGLDQGFKDAGFRTVVAVDNDQECVNSFKQNHIQARVAVADVSRLAIRDIDKLAGRRFSPLGVLGGPPCQSFSVSNVHQKDNDPRHRLPEAYASLLAKLNKRKSISFFVFENVPGLLGEKHRHRYEKFKRLFQKAGFELYEKLLDAKYFGVSQERPRIFIVGINAKKHPGRVWTPPEPETQFKTVRDTIWGLQDPVNNDPGLDPDSFPVHPNHWCLVPRSRKFENGTLRQGDMWGRSFRVLSWDKPSWTVAYGHREVHVHPDGKRRLSIYEAMLLQTFPKTYRLTGNMTAQVRLVSEAVPPLMAHKIANSIRASLGI